MRISLLYGTETGNTEMLCDDIQAELGSDHEVEIENLQDVSPADLSLDCFYIIVCSTYGEGELPQSALPFMEKLQHGQADLSQLRFSMFGLGDSAYGETYNNGSNVLVEALTAAGATIVGPRGLHDASGLEDAEEIALPWAKERVQEAAQLMS